MLQTINQAIIATLVFFDLVDFPLKEEEIFNWLFAQETSEEINFSFSQENIKQSLNQLLDQQIIAKKNQFYFLPGRENFILIREQRRAVSEQKIDKVQKLINCWLKHLPGIRAIFLSNSLAYLNAKEDSDIDLLIVAQKNRLWLTRLLAVLPLKIFNLRPTAQNKKDKFCLSYFISEDNLNLEPYEAQNEFSILVYWAVFVSPLFDRKNYWQKFCLANSWVKDFLPNFQFAEQNITQDFGYLAKEVEAVEKNFWETIAQKIQLWYLPDNLKKIMNLDGRVIVNDKIIKLHGNSQRKEIYDQWQERIKKI